MKMIRIITTLLFIVFIPLTVCGQKNPYWQEPTAAEAESNSLADGNPYIGPMPVEGRPDDHLYTESDEPHLNTEGHPYAQAKYYADQVVQQFIKNNPDTDVEIVSVYPTGVMGPALSNREDSTSVALQYLFKNRIAPNPFVQMLYDHDMEFSIVDVRDVAEGIYKAAATDGLHGKKYYLSNESWKVSDISRMLNNEQVQEKPRFVYSGKNAERDLGIVYKPASVSFADYAAGNKNSKP